MGPHLVLMSSTSILIMLVGNFSLLFGYLVKYLKMNELVAGAYSQRIKDKDGFGDWMGNHIILFGLIGFFFGLVGLLSNLFVGSLTILGFILSLFLIFIKVRNGIGKFIL